MVKISHVAIVAALASFVAASPIANPETKAVAMPILKERSLEVSVRSSDFNAVADLIQEIVQFLAQSLTDVLTLNLGDISNQVHTLLDNVNVFLGKLGTALQQFNPESGLLGDIQKTILGGGLEFLLLSLGNLLSHIIGVINPEDLTGQLVTDLQGLISQLNAVLTGTTATLGDLDNLPSILSSLLGDVSSVLNS